MASQTCSENTAVGRSLYKISSTVARLKHTPVSLCYTVIMTSFYNKNET